MNLLDALEARGLKLRKHLEEAGWLERKLTVVDLEPAEESILQQAGLEALERQMRASGSWPYPAADIARPLPAAPDVVLGEGAEPKAIIVAPGDEGPLQQAARQFAHRARYQYGLALPLRTDADAEPNMLEAGSVVVFGGAHENRFCLALTLKYLHDFADAAVPGPGGWLVAIHAGLVPQAHHAVQFAADEEFAQPALEHLLSRIEVRGQRIVLRHGIHIAPGREMQEQLPSWEEFLTEAARDIVHFKHEAFGGTSDRDPQIPEDAAEAARMFAVGFQSGGPDINLYNSRAFTAVCQAAHFYRMTGDRRALIFFREMLLELAAYFLATPEGASYPSDYDFPFGPVLLAYSRLEHEPLFTETDRLLLINLFLAGARSVFEYASRFWPVKPGQTTAHNHQTFPARSLLFAADYFSRYDIPDVKDWLDYVNGIFHGSIWLRFKHHENANLYEILAPMHCADYACFTGQGLQPFAPDVLEHLIDRTRITADNFLWPADYGDAGLKMKSDMLEWLPGRVAAGTGDEKARWLAHEAFDRCPNYLPIVHGALVGPRLGPGPQTTGSGSWQKLPVDPLFAREFDPDCPEGTVFDKLAFRTGWGPEDHYLLLEGIGRGAGREGLPQVSHSHEEVNGIVRLNHRGRLWVVSNGYGRRAGVTHAARSWNSRVLGPDDHNMLVFRQGEDIVNRLPVFSLLVETEARGSLACSTTVLPDYAGTQWFRTIVIMPDRFVVVIDRVEIIEPAATAGHIEWNCLGDVTERPGGWLLEQAGVCMEVQGAPEWPREQAWADQSADWKRVLTSGLYPHAEFPLPKLIFHLPQMDANTTLTHATLFAVSEAANAEYHLNEIEPGLFQVSWRGWRALPQEWSGKGLALELRPHRLRMDAAELPQLPG